MSQCELIFGDILWHFGQSSSNSHWSFEGLRRTMRRNFIQIRHRVKNFPIDTHCKNARFRQRHNVAEIRRFCQWGEYLICCWIHLKFRDSKFSLIVRLKTSNDWGEFVLGWARCYKNIAEISLALGHKTDSSVSTSQANGPSEQGLSIRDQGRSIKYIQFLARYRKSLNDPKL